VAFFAWLVALEKILTMDNLKKRQVIVVNRCCLSKWNGESTDHLLIHYEVFCVLWLLSSVALGCPKLCLIGWLICLLANGKVVALGALLCGR
jgi:hypothetical protein